MRTSSSTSASIDVAVVGAGPYGLSIAAHLTARAVPYRIFGIPMHTWRKRMPAGMRLKSDGFASNIYDPSSSLTLATYCDQHGIRYQHVGYPIPLETFVSYGMEFQRKVVPNLDETEVISLKQTRSGFSILTDAGESITALKVVIAVGVTHFAYLPPLFSRHSPEFVTHSAEHSDPTRLLGQTVAVVGGGSSAVDLAALLHEAGVDVQLLARRRAISFHQPVNEPRPWLERLKAPRSGLGLGWRSRLCTDAPLLFHALPEKLRLRIVQRHLGPAPGWFIRDRVEGVVPMHLGITFKDVAARDSRVKIAFTRQDGTNGVLTVDHVISATGYRVALRKLKFLDEELRSRIDSVDDVPRLRANFESSVKGLFMVGLVSANSFGPLTRFAYGAGFTARRITPTLAAGR